MADASTATSVPSTKSSVSDTKTGTSGAGDKSYAEAVKGTKKRTLSAYQQFVAERMRNDPNIKRLPNNKRLAAVGALWRQHKKKAK